MKALRPRSICCLLVGLLAVATPFSPRAQPPFNNPPLPPVPPPTNPTAQRNALQSVRAQVNWLRNAIRTASSYGSGGSGVVWQQFQILRQTYTSFKATLTPGQLNAGANELAELDAGLDILQQAFDEYQQDVAAGRSHRKAFQSMCTALDKGAVVWLEELNKTARRLGI